MSTFSAILATILGVVFVAVAVPKLTGQQQLVDEFKRWGYADAIRVATGAVELLAGVLLLVGIALPALAISGVLLVIFVMLGALATHLRARDRFAQWLPPVVLLALALTLVISLLPE
ncbi:MAG: DoxX family protein [Solirubrobacteraceae bacterium]